MTEWWYTFYMSRPRHQHLVLRLKMAAALGGRETTVLFQMLGCSPSIQNCRFNPLKCERCVRIKRKFSGTNWRPLEVVHFFPFRSRSYTILSGFWFKANEVDSLTIVKIHVVRHVAVKDVGTGISFSPTADFRATVGNHQPSSIILAPAVLFGNLKGAFNRIGAIDGKTL